MGIEEIKAFETSDGSIFTSEALAQKHETEENLRISINFYVLGHCGDLPDSVVGQIGHFICAHSKDLLGILSLKENNAISK